MKKEWGKHAVLKNIFCETLDRVDEEYLDEIHVAIRCLSTPLIADIEKRYLINYGKIVKIEEKVQWNESSVIRTFLFVDNVYFYVGGYVWSYVPFGKVVETTDITENNVDSWVGRVDFRYTKLYERGDALVQQILKELSEQNFENALSSLNQLEKLLGKELSLVKELREEFEVLCAKWFEIELDRFLDTEQTHKLHDLIQRAESLLGRNHKCVQQMGWVVRLETGLE